MKILVMKRYGLPTLFTCVAGLLVACSAWTQQGGSGLAGTVNLPPGHDSSAAAPTGAEAKQAEPPAGPKQEAIVLRARIAQLMLLTVQGLYGPQRDETEFLQHHIPGGVVIPVVVEPRDAAEFIAQLRGIEAKAGIPLLIGTQLYDLPRRQHLFRSSFAQLPTLLSIAASTDSDAVGRLARLMAEHLDAMGFNLNLGPRLDLAATLANAQGGVDNLGSDPRFAAEVAGTILDTLKDKKILGMPMGFPGGGENRTGNSPATLLTPKVHLMDLDLLPFRKAIEHGAPLIHVGDTLVPTLDTATQPACLSRAVIHDLLRGELKYEGLIVAGPVDGPDIERQFDSASAAVMALQAGADMIYWTEAGQKASRAIEVIAKAVEDGTLERTVVDAAFDRIVQLKKDHHLAERDRGGASKAASLGRGSRYSKEAYEVERRSITILQNKNNVLPLVRGRSTPLGITGVYGVDALETILKKRLKQVIEQNIQTAAQLGDIEDFEISRITRGVPGLKTVVCVLGPMKRQQGEIRLIRELKATGVHVVVVWLGNPRPLAELLEADAIVAAYCDPTMCDASIKACADVLLEDCPVAVLPAVRELKTQIGKEEIFNAPDVLRAPAGRLPVSLGESFVAGYGVSYAPAPFIRAVKWDFGDGKRAAVTRAVHAYEKAGRYEATLEVTDRSGAVASGRFPVVVE